MSILVGDESELVNRIKHQKHIWINGGLQEFLKNQGTGYLVRAINHSELGQLVGDGPEKFLVHGGTNFEFDYVNHVKTYSHHRSGTIIVCPFERKDISLEINKGDFDETKKILYQGGGRACALKDFLASVELYNIYGLEWEQLKDTEDSRLMDRDYFM